MINHPLNDAMKPRLLSARWVIRGMLTLETPLHLGGEGDGRVDMPVLRDTVDCKPLLPGTNLAGALRSALADRLAGYADTEPPKVAVLFGGARGDDNGFQSPLIVFDAVGEIPAGQSMEIRDGVAIEPRTGVAEDRKKYDYEVLPAGTTFPVRVDLLLSASAIEDRDSPPDEKSLLEYLAAALDTFSHGEGAFGAKRSRGLGRVTTRWAARRFDLSSREGWLEWILSDHERPFAANPDQPCIRDVLDAAAPESLRPFSLPGDTRKRVVIDLDLTLDHDILIRSPGIDPDDPDVSHLRSGGVAIIPGTSLAGVMRAQALRIAKLVRDSKNDGERWVNHLFGPRFKGQRPSSKEIPQASRLRVGEARLEGSRPRQQTRVAIDRFTQGVVDTALFDEQTETGGRARVRLELRNAKEGEVGLMLLVLKDLLSGALPVGGTSSVGRGGLHGTATVTWYKGDGTAPCSATIQPGIPPAGDAAGKIDDAIHAFHQAEIFSSSGNG